MLTQFSKASSNTTDSNNPITAPVSSLLLSCGPSAVSRLITVVVIDPIKRCSGRSCADIFKEVFKRLSPSFTDGNPSSSVIRVCLLGWIIAAVNYVLPNVIDRCLHASHRLAVGDEGLFHPLFPVATAGLRVPASEGSVQDDVSVSTFTKALALAKGRATTFALWLRFSNDGKSSKCFSDDVYCDRHTDGGSSVVFSSGRPASTGAHCDYGYFGMKNKT